MNSKVNNPFGKSPVSVVDQAAQRFPDVLGTDPHFGLDHPQPPVYPQQTGYSYQQQSQQYQPHQQYGLQPQQTGYTNYGYGGGGGGGGGGGAPQYASPQGYPGQAQYGQQRNSVSDLDPYASLGAFTGQAGAATGSTGGASSSQPGTLLAVPQIQAHPRQFVQENRTSLMNWDEYAWKQLFSRVDSLREAWEQRVAGIRAAANQGADPTSVDRLKRDAESNVDSIHAAKMQMNEVKTGWKHSTDPASKARVREALNAGLSAMPEYPSPLSPDQLGGAFYRNAADEHRKSTIMSQFAGGGGQQQGGGYQYSQQTGLYGGGGGGMGGMMQPQPTGYGQFAGGGGGGMIQPQQTGYGQFGGGMSMQPQQTGYGGFYPSGPGNGPYYG